MATRTAFDFYMLGEVSEDQLNDPEKRQQYKDLWRKMDLTERKPFMEKASSLRTPTPAIKTKKTRTTAPGNKKAPSPYVLYVHDPANKNPIKEQFPDKAPKEIVSILAAKWNQLSDEEKKPWVLKHEEKKAELIANPQPRAVSNKTPGVKYKRAKSAYIQYSTDPKIRAPIVEANPEAKPNEITKLISAQWNGLTTEEKQPYQDLYEKERQELIDNPQPKPQKKQPVRSAPAQPSLSVDSGLKKQVAELLQFKQAAEERITKLEQRLAQLEG